MKKSPLSIFSFDMFGLAPSSTIVAFVTSLLMLAGVEGLCRVLLIDATEGWDYWTQTAANKYVTYAHLRAQQNIPPVLIVGDSSADYGFSPVDFSEVLGVPDAAYNLATLGNFPLSFDQTINQMVLDAPGPHPEYLFIIFTRGGFEQRDRLWSAERSVLQSPVVQRHNGRLTIGDAFVLTRLWRSRVSLLDQVRYGAAPTSSERGFVARDGHSSVEPAKLAQQRPFILDPARLAVLEHTFMLSRHHQIQPILIHPPIHSLERSQWTNPDAYAQAVQQICDQYQVPFWDYSQDARYDERMRDLVHLNKEGARAFSGELARRFQEWTQR